MRLGLVLGLCFWITSLFASFVVDMYGDDSKKGETILKKYQTSLINLHKKRLALYAKPEGKEKTKLIKQLKNTHQQLVDKIKKEGGYLYSDDSIVMYPGSPVRYITLEVIKSQDKDRMHWVRSPKKCVHCSPKNDVIQAMLDYEELGTKLFMTNQIDVRHVDCKGYHCTYGFSHPQLKPFKKRFDEGLTNQRQLIIDSLDDPNPERRAAAAFIIAEFNDPRIIFRILLPHVNDNNDHVRNNVIRVIGETMMNSHEYKIDVNPFIKLLRSPFLTDRNKSLAVLMFASRLKEQQSIIRQKGLQSLEQLVKLKQPNNHDFAKMILTGLNHANG